MLCGRIAQLCRCANRPAGTHRALGVRMLHRIQGLFSLFLLLAACSLCIAQEPYFPPSVFGEGKWGVFEARIDGFYLKRLQEPSLLTEAQSTSTEAYRFLWLRTFHNPVAVRMELQSNGSSILTIKVADGHAGFPRTVTKLIQNTTRSISREQTDAFRKKVQTEGFWNARSRDIGAPDTTDADGWIFEAVTKGKYHIVTRTIPNTLPETCKTVQNLGLMLAIDLGQLNIPEDER